MASSSSSEPQKDVITELEVSFLCDVDNHKVIYMEADGRLVDIILAFLAFPIKSLNKLGVGAMPQICASLANLSVETTQPGFNNSEFFELTPSDDVWYNKLLTLLNGISSSSSVPLFLCGKCNFNAKMTNFTTDLTTPCPNCNCQMQLDLPSDPSPNTERIVANSDIIFHIFDDMRIMPEGDHLDTLSMIMGMGIEIQNCEEKKLTLTAEKICSLLKALVEKNTVLTDLFSNELFEE